MSQKSSQINLAAATKEELVELIKKQNVRLKETQQQRDDVQKRSAMQIEDLESQLQCLGEQGTLLKEQVTELQRNAQRTKSSQPDPTLLEPLQQQIGLLSDKIATDEETITELVQQLEAARAGGHPADAHSATRISELEAQLGDQDDTNKFYASIVAQQDADERDAKARIEKLERENEALQSAAASCKSCHTLRDSLRDAHSDHEELEAKLAALRDKYWAVKKANDQDQLRMDTLLLKMGHLERESVEFEKRTTLEVEEVLRKAQREETSTPRNKAAAESLGTESDTSGLDDVASNSRPPQQAVIIQASSISTPTGSSALPQRHPALQQTLPVVPIVRNPNRREAQLLERMQQFDSRLKEWVAYETARQKNLDEVERNRAEMFLALNKELEERRKEVAQLRSRMRSDENLTGHDVGTHEEVEAQEKYAVQLSKLEGELREAQKKTELMSQLPTRVEELESEKQEREQRFKDLVEKVKTMKSVNDAAIQEKQELSARLETTEAELNAATARSSLNADSERDLQVRLANANAQLQALTKENTSLKLKAQSSVPTSPLPNVGSIRQRNDEDLALLGALLQSTGGSNSSGLDEIRPFNRPLGSAQIPTAPSSDSVHSSSKIPFDLNGAE